MLVRQHGTPYWTVTGGDGCVREDRDSGWTLVDVKRPGLLQVRARFSALGAVRHAPRCRDPKTVPAGFSTDSPPVTGR